MSEQVPGNSQAGCGRINCPGMVKETVLDVSALEPPEPLERVLAAVAELQPGERLRILHRREPFPLYELLERDGFTYRVLQGEKTAYEILIWHADDHPDS